MAATHGRRKPDVCPAARDILVTRRRMNVAGLSGSAVNEHEESPHMLSNILVPLDGSTLSERALPYAAELARRAGARLTLVRASRVDHDIHWGPPEEHPEQATTNLRAQADQLRR